MQQIQGLVHFLASLSPTFGFSLVILWMNLVLGMPLLKSRGTLAYFCIQSEHHSEAADKYLEWLQEGMQSPHMHLLVLFIHLLILLTHFIGFLVCAKHSSG